LSGDSRNKTAAPGLYAQALFANLPAVEGKAPAPAPWRCGRPPLLTRHNSWRTLRARAAGPVRPQDLIAIAGNLDAAIAVGTEPASAIERAVTDLVHATTAQRLARFHELVARFFREWSEHSGWLCELALRLASDPTDLSAWAREKLENGLRRLHDKPVIPRAARFLVLAVSRQLAEHSIVSGDLHPGWSWE